MISSISNISHLSSGKSANFTRKISQFCLDLVAQKTKQHTINNPKHLNFIDFCEEKISSSYNQRLILGATAIASQPFIDMANKKVDEETRRVSVCRTLAKILVGTTTGYLIRRGCVKSIDFFTQYPSAIPKNAKFKKLRSILLPTVEHTAEQLANHKNTLGTLMALGVMVFTNFLIDAPLTKFFTNLFMRKEGIKHEK